MGKSTMQMPFDCFDMAKGDYYSIRVALGKPDWREYSLEGAFDWRQSWSAVIGNGASYAYDLGPRR